MKEDLHKTRWNRLSIRLHVPQAMGVFLVAAREDGAGGDMGPETVLLVGSAQNLRAKLLEIFEVEEIRTLSARAVHWVAGLTAEQARLAELQFIRRYNPPVNLAGRSRYLDILAG
ncbi:MAG: hypothetical protein H0W36_07095 [Gemmatimonadetes bacterium]|nr:hypothetical protein [Gemmatimonadota bacterium]